MFVSAEYYHPFLPFYAPPSLPFLSPHTLLISLIPTLDLIYIPVALSASSYHISLLLFNTVPSKLVQAWPEFISLIRNIEC